LEYEFDVDNDPNQYVTLKTKKKKAYIKINKESLTAKER
jgi:hypothetical protein